MRFAAHDFVHDVPHLNDMSDTEVDALYMTREEIVSIKGECLVTVSMIEKGIKADTCIRGLVHHTDKYIAKAKMTRKQIYSVVNTVQRFRAETGNDITKLLARMVKRVSLHSVKAAIALAHEDARTAVRINKTTPAIQVVLPTATICHGSPASQITKAMVKDVSYQRSEKPLRDILERRVPILPSRENRVGCTNLLSKALDIMEDDDVSSVGPDDQDSLSSRA